MNLTMLGTPPAPKGRGATACAGGVAALYAQPLPASLTPLHQRDRGTHGIVAQLERPSAAMTDTRGPIALGAI